jgi:putative flippase GtrA
MAGALGDPARAPRSLLGQVWGFGLVSGLGLTLDVVVFAVLVLTAGVTPFWANLAGAALAVTFVFCASVRRVFADRGGFLIGRFLVYAAWQAVGITAASWLVDHLALHLPALAAKLAMLPLTFSANFLVMRAITRRAPPMTSP